MKNCLNHHVSMIDEITADFRMPDSVPDTERAGRLESHVVGVLTLKGIEKTEAVKAFKRWRADIRGSLRLFEPGCEPTDRLATPRYLVDVSTSLVLAGRC